MKIGFLKNERTLSKNSITELYASGYRVKSSSCTLLWKKSDTNSPKIKLLINVPKKNIKKAVDRNYIKRLIRESYTLNKSSIYSLIKGAVEIVLIYNKSSLPKFNKLNTELLTLFKVIHKYQNEIN